jgi:hypothetical protein
VGEPARVDYNLDSRRVIIDFAPFFIKPGLIITSSFIGYNRKHPVHSQKLTDQSHFWSIMIVSRKPSGFL